MSIGSDNPRRPASLSQLDLGFAPSGPVRWLRQENLATFHRDSGAGPDTRYSQAVLPARIEDLSDRAEIWIDYVAGTGDGFAATFSVAWGLAQRSLSIEGVGEGELPRGDVLIAGGDLVQPGASRPAYADRFEGPFQAAWPAGWHHAAMFALPGRTDWQDGLDSFRDVFLMDRLIGGWSTPQSRSYFAVRLPHGWWLWGLDLKDGSPIDRPQIEYFAEASHQLEPGDRVILCEPSLNRLSPRAEAATDSFDPINDLIRPHGATMPLHISGRNRFYARYQREELGSDEVSQFIACGSGGSYTSGTDHLPHSVAGEDVDAYLESRYPSAAKSRLLSLRALWGLARNPGFLTLLGALHLLFLISIVGFPEGVDGPAVLLVATALAAVLAPGQFGSLSDMLHRATTFGVPLESAALRVRLFAGANILVQVALGLAGVAAWRALGFTDRGGWWPLLALLLVYALMLAAAGAVLAGVTLLVARIPLFRVHLEVLFAAAGCQDMKAFLRMHISEDGELEVFAVAVEQVCHRWRLEPAADDPEASWLAPEPALTPRLVERIRFMRSEAERHVAIR